MLPKKDDPLNILILAIPFLAGGIIMLLRNSPGIIRAYPAYRSPGSFVGEVSVPTEHAAGVVGLIIGGLIILFYFRIRNG